MMKVTKHILLLWLMIVMISCESKGQNANTELALKKCINESVNRDIREAYGKKPFDFYDFILKIEEELISNGLLSSKDKKDYLNFIDQLFDNSGDKKYVRMYEQQNVIIDEFGFGFNSFTINDNIFNQCPYKVASKKKDGEGKLIYEQAITLNKLMAQGYENESLLKELVKEVDEKNFKKIVYRAPVILLIMINLDRQYNADLKNLEEREKGRKFLNKS